MRNRRAAVLATLAAATMILGACQGGGASQNSDKLRIGIKFDQPGLGMQVDGQYRGFDVDVARYVASKLGFAEDKIEFVEAVSAQRETMLQNGDVDYIVGTYSITDKRKEVVGFAGPYFVAGQDLLVRDADTDITGPESLDGKNLCSVTGSTSAQRVKDDFANNVQLIEQPGYAQCIQFLSSGQVDAVTTDDVILAGLAAANPDANLRVVGEPFSEENYGVGLPKGSERCEAVAQALQDMIDDGEWQKALDNGLQGISYTPQAVNPPTPVASC